MKREKLSSDYYGLDWEKQMEKEVEEVNLENQLELSFNE